MGYNIFGTPGPLIRYSHFCFGNIYFSWLVFYVSRSQQCTKSSELFFFYQGSVFIKVDVVLTCLYCTACQQHITHYNHTTCTHKYYLTLLEKIDYVPQNIITTHCMYQLNSCQVDPPSIKYYSHSTPTHSKSAHHQIISFYKKTYF